MSRRKTAGTTHLPEIGSKAQGDAFLTEVGHRQRPDRGPGGDASQTAILMRKRKEIQECQQQLVEKRKEIDGLMEECDKKQAYLREKQKEFKDRATKLEPFLRDLEARQARAKKKMADELKKQKDLDSEIFKLTAERETLMAVKEDKKQNVEKMNKYQKYLEDVVEASGNNFQEVDDILNRYHTLKATNSDLQDEAVRSRDMIADLQNQISREKVDKENHAVRMNNELAVKKTDLETLRTNTQLMEQDVSRFAKDSVSAAALLGEVSMAIRNLYDRCASNSIIGNGPSAAAGAGGVGAMAAMGSTASLQLPAINSARGEESSKGAAKGRTRGRKDDKADEEETARAKTHRVVLHALGTVAQRFNELTDIVRKGEKWKSMNSRRVSLAPLASQRSHQLADTAGTATAYSGVTPARAKGNVGYKEAITFTTASESSLSSFYPSTRSHKSKGRHETPGRSNAGSSLKPPYRHAGSAQSVHSYLSAEAASTNS